MPRLSRSLIHYSLFPKNLRPLFYNDLLRGIADGALGIFMPIFLFAMGENIKLSGSHWSPFFLGAALVSIYYCLQRLVVLFFAFPLSRVIMLIGYRWGVILGNLSRCLTLISLHLAKTDARFLILAFISGAVDLVLDGVSHDCIFASEARYDHMGRDVGALAFLSKLLQIAVPAVGGLIILIGGYSTLFEIGIVCILASCIPALFIPVIKVSKVPTLQELFLWLHDTRFIKFAFALSGKYMDIIAVLLWPIYVLLVVGKIQRVGYVFSIVLFVSLVLTYVVGWYMDHRKHKRLFLGSGVILSLIWLSRTLVHGIGDIVAVDTMDKLVSSVYSPCYDAYMFERCKGKNVLAFTLYREVLYSFFAVILWVIIGGVFLLSTPWIFIFMIGALGVTLSLLLDGKIRS